MSLNNTAKYIIGSLEAMDIVLLVSLSDPVRFPMDPIFLELLARNKNAFQEMIDLVSEICQMESVHDELYSVVDSIVVSSVTNFYTEEAVTLLLNLYMNNPDIKRFHYQNITTFHNELRPIFDAVIIDLFDALMSGRIVYYSMYPVAKIRPLKPLILRLLTIIYHVIPENIMLPAPTPLFSKLVDDWIKMREHRARDFPLHEENKEYIRVIQELR